MKKAVLIGNGPSKSFFPKDNIPDDWDCFGFNFSNDSYLKNIFISDTHVWPKIKKTDRHIFLKKEDVYDHRIQFLVTKNTSQAVYEYLRNKGYNEFHLFGHDLMWEDSFKSDTDKFIPKDWWIKIAKEKNLQKRWMSYWVDIIDVKTYIYIPKGKQLLFSNKNVELVETVI